jgi:Zn-dependent peptidase ImmA (M78 family)/DNA-binding XRE family transcriptional regulator
MPKKSLCVEVKPEVFKWLRESSGWTREEIAKRIKTSTQNIQNIETGNKKPTIRQLKELSNVFKRPVASFFLDEPIQEKPKPKDYRMLPNKVNKFDKKTIYVLRKARRLQVLCKELSLNIDYDTKVKIKKVKLSDNPKEIAKKYRSLLELTEEKQRRFKTSYELFNYLRDIFEDMNIFVFQYSMPVEDARGFVFVDESPYVIVVNSKDRIEARIFSLMHEFGHILLGESAIDLPDATLKTRNSIEKWCNEFSSSFLLPGELAVTIFESNIDKITHKKSLTSLSNKYKVSKAMLLLKMLKLNYIKKEDYENILQIYKPKIKTKKKSKASGGIPSDKKRLSEVGNKFVSLVANNYDRENITYTDALNYLSIKSRKFDALLSKARK